MDNYNHISFDEDIEKDYLYNYDNLKDIASKLHKLVKDLSDF